MTKDIQAALDAHNEILDAYNDAHESKCESEKAVVVVNLKTLDTLMTAAKLYAQALTTPAPTGKAVEVTPDQREILSHALYAAVPCVSHKHIILTLDGLVSLGYRIITAEKE